MGTTNLRTWRQQQILRKVRKAGLLLQMAAVEHEARVSENDYTTNVAGEAIAKLLADAKNGIEKAARLMIENGTDLSENGQRT